MQKDFNNWNILKQELDANDRLPSFKQREIWWCHIGLNIGDEENGKNKDYHRPILIIRKFNNSLFLGVPLTTKIKNNLYYHLITFKNNNQCVMLSQFKVLASKRLDRKIGQFSRNSCNKIKKALSEIILR